MLEKLKLKLKKEGEIKFRAKIDPKSKESKIVGELDTSTLKIRIAATPTQGKANKELIKLLSDTFKVPKSNIKITSGHTSPIKTINVQQ